MKADVLPPLILPRTDKSGPNGMTDRPEDGVLLGAVDEVGPCGGGCEGPVEAGREAQRVAERR